MIVALEADDLQDIQLRELQTFLPDAWNQVNALPLHQWLQAEKYSNDEEERMKLLGNLVVPACADLAGDLLLRMARQN